MMSQDSQVHLLRVRPPDMAGFLSRTLSHAECCFRSARNKLGDVSGSPEEC